MRETGPHLTEAPEGMSNAAALPPAVRSHDGHNPALRRLTLSLASVILMLLLAACHARETSTQPAAAPTPTGTPASAKDANYLSQSKYYDAQRNSIEQQTSLWWISAGPWLASFALGIVALYQFLANYRISLETERNTQYANAVKQFGNKKSPALRAAGAALIGAKGADRRDPSQNWLKLSGIGPHLPHYPNEEIASTHLATGLLIEDDVEVLSAMSLAFQQIISAGSDLGYANKSYGMIGTRLCYAKRRSEIDTVQTLGTLTATTSGHHTATDSIGEAETTTIVDRAAEVYPLCDRQKLTELLGKPEALEQYRGAHKAALAQHGGTTGKTEQKLRLALERMRLLDGLLQSASERAVKGLSPRQRDLLTDALTGGKTAYSGTELRTSEALQGQQLLTITFNEHQRSDFLGRAWLTVRRLLYAGHDRRFFALHLTAAGTVLAKLIALESAA
jgi:hypothetical protein